MPKFRTTKADFEYYRERCYYWADRFGFSDWEIVVYHEDCDDGDKAVMGWHVADRVARFLALRLTQTWSERPTKKLLDDTAFHEVVEGGMFADLRQMAMEHRSYSYEDAMSAVHAQVHRLERLFLKRDE